MGILSKIDLGIAKDERSMIFDCMGVGFGPANIALGISLSDMGFRGSCVFLERLPAPDWQPDMLIAGSDIQHNPLRDFVTLRDPSNHFSFLNYLKSEGRLIDFLNIDRPFPPRTEYAKYVRWAARHFDDCVSYGDAVISLAVETDGSSDPLIVARTSRGRIVKARALSFAPGRTPHIPVGFHDEHDGRVVHFTKYLSAVSRWSHQKRLRSVAVVGASQSAVEIILDLSNRFPDLEIHSLVKGYSFQLKDTSPFTEHIYFPEFVDEFYNSSEMIQNRLRQELRRSNYGSVDHDILSDLYYRLYQQRLSGGKRIHLHSNCRASVVHADADLLTLKLDDEEGREVEKLSVDAVILATGFLDLGASRMQEAVPPLLRGFADRLARRDDGSLHVARDYRLEAASPDAPLPTIFLNGLCESTHGFGDAGSFSLLSLRSWSIAQSIVASLAESGAAAAAQPALA